MPPRRAGAASRRRTAPRRRPSKPGRTSTRGREGGMRRPARRGPRCHGRHRVGARAATDGGTGRIPPARHAARAATGSSGRRRTRPRARDDRPPGRAALHAPRPGPPGTTRTAHRRGSRRARAGSRRRCRPTMRGSRPRSPPTAPPVVPGHSSVGLALPLVRGGCRLTLQVHAPYPDRCACGPARPRTERAALESPRVILPQRHPLLSWTALGSRTGPRCAPGTTHLSATEFPST